MAGSYVFPGGRVDDGDRPPAGARLPRARIPRPERCGGSRVSHRRGARAAGRSERPHHGRRSAPLRALGHAGDRDSPLRHALLPGAHAGTDRSPSTTRARRRRSSGCRRAKRSSVSSAASCCCRRRPTPASGSSRRASSIDDVFAWAKSRPIARVMPGFFKNGDVVMLTLPGDPTVPDDSRLGSAGGNAVRAAGRSAMAAR